MVGIPLDGRITSLDVLSVLSGSEVMEIVSPGNEQFGNNYQVTVTVLGAFFVGLSIPIKPTYVITTPYVPLATDTILLMNVAGPSVVNLPLASSRSGVPLMIKDYAGLAGNGTNTITVNRSSPDLIDGLTTFAINVDYGGYRIGPCVGGWFFMP
jgi:hypothetical protein